MKKRLKIYLKLNLMSLVFIIISFISVTLAWFAYSGLSEAQTIIDVKTWYIELEKDGEKVSNNRIISLSEIYPGMDTVKEVVKIKNLGDSDAQVKYSIVSARILDNSDDNYIINDTDVQSYFVEDNLSHNYPFHINLSLSKSYALSKEGESIFEVSVSWPLDSGNNEFDTLWGTKAYQFQKNEEDKKTADANYQVQPSIQVIISVTAEQYIESDESSDTHYNLGDTILFDVVSKSRCLETNSTCLKTFVIDDNNKIGDDVVTLLPDPSIIYSTAAFSSYNNILSSTTTNWEVNNRALLTTDILKIISNDVTNTHLIREGISDSIVGNLKYEDRINDEINNAINGNGYYKFYNEKFNFLLSNDCYWTNSSYNSNNAFAIKVIDDDYSKLYGEDKNTTCKVIPVIIANKSNL